MTFIEFVWYAELTLAAAFPVTLILACIFDKDF